MNKNILTLLLFSLFLTVSCTTDNSKNPFLNEIELKSEVWGIGDNLGNVYDIAIGDNYLFLRNKAKNSLLSAIPLNNKKEILNFGVKGRATEELISPGPILVTGDKISVYDSGKQSIMEFELDTDNNQFSFNNNINIELNGITSMVKLSNNCYLASGMLLDGRFGMLNSHGQVVNYFSEYSIGSEDIKSEFHILGMAYISNLKAHSDGERVVAACRYAGLLEVYKYDNNQQSFTRVSEYNIFPPKYSTQEVMGYPQFMPNKETQWAYLSVTSNDKYIFALYSGKVQHLTDDFFTSDIVDVFDWNGNQVCRLKLDLQSYAITANKNGMYSLFKDSEGRYDIAQYKLSL